METTEQWKEFPLDPRYKVSDHGRVMSPSGRILSVKPNNLGYIKFWIFSHKNNIGVWIGKYRGAHQMVALTYIPNPNSLPEVKHKDGNKANNHVSNLEWTTHRDNIIHSYLTRKTPRGKDHYLYGTKKSPEAKLAMSLQKIGEKHPKFKGWYMKKGVKYASSYLAEKGTGEVGRTISRQAHANKNGWSFVPKDSLPVTTPHEVPLEIIDTTCTL